MTRNILNEPQDILIDMRIRVLRILILNIAAKVGISLRVIGVALQFVSVAALLHLVEAQMIARYHVIERIANQMHGAINVVLVIINVANILGDWHYFGCAAVGAVRAVVIVRGAVRVVHVILHLLRIQNCSICAGTMHEERMRRLDRFAGPAIMTIPPAVGLGQDQMMWFDTIWIEPIRTSLLDGVRNIAGPQMFPSIIAGHGHVTGSLNESNGEGCARVGKGHEPSNFGDGVVVVLVIG
mmetsp:Transcript_14389/g.23757  ORF Transcript_14389/g.23757 Transcript_14389/m.23757 type:complete len:240 (+) Transcript_14389:452-1171(+)